MNQRDKPLRHDTYKEAYNATTNTKDKFQSLYWQKNAQVRRFIIDRRNEN